MTDMELELELLLVVTAGYQHYCSSIEALLDLQMNVVPLWLPENVGNSGEEVTPRGVAPMKPSDVLVTNPNPDMLLDEVVDDDSEDAVKLDKLEEFVKVDDDDDLDVESEVVLDVLELVRGRLLLKAENGKDCEPELAVADVAVGLADVLGVELELVLELAVTGAEVVVSLGTDGLSVALAAAVAEAADELLGMSVVESPGG